MSEPGAAMTLDLAGILRVLPHRPPMLLLDHVRLLEPPLRIVALKTLRDDDPWFAGHFPGHAVMPGVLLVEALAQAGAVLAAHSVGDAMQGQLPYLVNIEQARLRKPVRPGQTLELHVRRERAWGRFWQLQGQALVDGECVASAVLLAALMPAPADPSRSDTAPRTPAHAAA